MALEGVGVEVQARRRKAFIDGVGVTLDGSGKAKKNVTVNEYHHFQYYVEGDEGSSFTAGITDPKDVKKQHEGKFDSSGKDAGSWWFILERADD